jgi:hypothetical protein
VALAGKLSNVIPWGLALHLLAILHISRVVQPYIHAQKVADEDLPEIIPTINRVPGQVVEPGPIHVDQVNGEKLDDEEVIIHPTHPACKVVIL